MTYTIIVHGGASPVPPEEAEAYKSGCIAALEAGWNILSSGGSALDAVEAAIRVFEEDPTFNAACGGMLNADGEVQLDAAIMDGSDLCYGGLGAATGLRHPISVARKILEVGPLMLVAEGVRRFAAGRDAELCDPAELITDKQRKQWEENEQQLRQRAKPGNTGTDTVGCVALDSQGRLAVGTSTGGEDHNPPGRLGDSAQVGCGFYADDTLGACAVTGTGEAIAQVVLAKSCIELLAAGIDPDTASQQMIDTLGERVDGEGGCITVDHEGRIGWAHNSSDMPIAYRTNEMDELVYKQKKG